MFASLLVGHTFLATAQTNVAALKDAGIKSVYYESPETAHEWLTWRRSLREFAPLLFNQQTSTSLPL